MRINLTKRPGWRKVTALLGAAAISAAALSTVGGPASADGSNEPLPTIVLVHGAFADASGWNDVTRRLLADNRDKLDAVAEALLERESLDELDVYAAADIDRQAVPASA